MTNVSNTKYSLTTKFISVYKSKPLLTITMGWFGSSLLVTPPQLSIHFLVEYTRRLKLKHKGDLICGKKLYYLVYQAPQSKSRCWPPPVTPMNTQIHQRSRQTAILSPKKLTFVEKMPYYVISNTLKNAPEGSFSPQTVDVIEAEVHWATSGNWWKIHTDFGDRWIKTAPWQIEVPPPATIRLMSETPLYARTSEDGGPMAALSPQEVTVVDAEKSSWFRQAEMDYNPKRWIKIHTTWLGDQWVHLHLDEIGTLQPLDRTVYYPSVYYGSSPHMDYITYQYEGLLTKMFVHQTAKYRTLLGNSYQFDTENGPKWSLAPDMPITSDKKIIKRTQPSPLFAYPDSNAEIVTEVPPGDLNVVETTLNDDGFSIHEKNGFTSKTSKRRAGIARPMPSLTVWWMIRRPFNFAAM